MPSTKNPFNFEMEDQQLKYTASNIFKDNEYFNEEAEDANVLDKEVADTIIKNKKKKIEWSIDKYYKTHYMSQAAEGTKTDKEQINIKFLQTVDKYYSEEIKSGRDIENEEKRDLFIAATGANKDMLLDDKITVKDWFVDGEFGSEYVVMYKAQNHILKTW